MTKRAHWIASYLFIVLLFAGCPGSDSGGGDGVSLRQRYQEALKISSPTSRANRLIEVARDQHAAGDTTGARTSLDDAYAAAGEGEAPGARALAFNSLAAAEAEFGRRSRAEDALREARKAAMSIEDAVIKAEQLGRIAVTYGTKLEEPSKASSYLSMAVDTTKEADTPALQAEAMIALAHSHHRLGQTAEAEELAAQATDTAKQIEDAGKQADTLGRIAEKLTDMQQGERAAAAFDEAVAVAEKISDATTKAHVLADLALKLDNAGKGGRGQELLKRAEAAADQIQDPGLKKEAERKIDEYRSKL